MEKALKISSKGQITIPIAIRRRLGVDGGDQVKFIIENGKAVLQPVRAETNPFSRWIGAFPAFKTVDEVNQWMREMRGYEDGDDDHGA